MTPDPDSVPLLADGSFWLFGYGSLIWRPDLPWVERRPALLPDHARRFWQGSHDHRGTAAAPGRVVTLVEAPGARCAGMAYRVAPAAAPEVLARLDHREKNGYRRHALAVRTREGDDPVALVYLATEDNSAWLGDDDPERIARQIASARGPSGPNRVYLEELAAALTRLGADDPHVFDLARRVATLPV